MSCECPLNTPRKGGLGLLHLYLKPVKQAYMDHLEYLEIQSGNSTHDGSQLYAFDTERDSGVVGHKGLLRFCRVCWVKYVLWTNCGHSEESWHMASLGAVS